MRKVGIVDTTLRDAHQCLWATRMTTAMMLPVAPVLDRAGFEAIEAGSGATFDVCVRYLREDPWERMRILSKAITRTPQLVFLRGQSLFTFELFSDDVVELAVKRVAANGIRYVTILDALNDMRNLEVLMRAIKTEGLYVTGWLIYTISPVHTDEYYAQKARELVSLGVDGVVLEDASGIVTVERARTLIPALRAAIGSLPLQFHTHCLTGAGPLVALEAIKLGVDAVQTATPPLAHGAAPPPTDWIVSQARQLGYQIDVDLDALSEVTKYFTYVAAREGFPPGQAVEHDAFQYDHQMAGGMISNLRNQLREAGLEHRLQEILEESVRVRQELGHLIIVSPFAQFILTQSVINVIHGERYAVVPDEIRKYALGYYGRPAAPIDPDVLDRIVGNEEPVSCRAGELIPPTLERVRRERGPFASDEDLLLAVFYSPDICARLAGARPIKTRYPVSLSPESTLVREIAARPNISRFTFVQGQA